MSMQAMNAEAASFAGAVSSKLGEFQKQFGRGGRSADYKDLQGSLDRMEAAVEDAIAKDQEEASSFWNELKMALRDGFDYPRKKREFDNSVNALVSDTREKKALLSSLVSSEGIPKLKIPDELQDISAQWDGARARTDEAAAVIPQLKDIEGWGGDAHQQYQTMTSVQVEALKEYREFPKHMADGYHQMGLLNAAVLGALYDCVEVVLRQSQDFPAAGANEYYVRAAAMCGALRHSLDQLEKILELPDDAAAELKELLDTVQEAPVVLPHEGWPHGIEQAGQEAGDTRGPGGARPAGPVVPIVDGPGETDDGVDR